MLLPWRSCLALATRGRLPLREHHSCCYFGLMVVRGVFLAMHAEVKASYWIVLFLNFWLNCKHQ
jgi:hypothetical protein